MKNKDSSVRLSIKTFLALQLFFFRLWCIKTIYLSKSMLIYQIQQCFAESTCKQKTHWQMKFWKECRNYFIKMGFKGRDFRNVSWCTNRATQPCKVNPDSIIHFAVLKCCQVKKVISGTSCDFQTDQFIPIKLDLDCNPNEHFFMRS